MEVDGQKLYRLLSVNKNKHKVVFDLALTFKTFSPPYLGREKQ